jgi:hypothetical protein
MINYLKRRLTTFYILTVVAFLLQYISGGKSDVFMFMLLLLYPIVLPVSGGVTLLGIEADPFSSIVINLMVITMLYFSVIYLFKFGIKKNMNETPLVKVAASIIVLCCFTLNILLAVHNTFSYISIGIFYSIALLTLFLVVHRLVKGPGITLQKDES